MTFTFVEARGLGEVNRVGRLDIFENNLHSLVELLGPENVIIAAAIGNECGDVARHRGPVNVRIHRTAPADGIAREEHRPFARFLF